VIRALREVEGGLRLLMNVWLRVPALRRAPVRESFLRQIYFTGVTASTGVVLRASGLGALIIAFTMQVLDADTSLAVKILLWVVLREVGPLAAAMVVILRTGTAVSAELAMMRISGQTDTLRRMGIEPYDYLVVPRVMGVMVATAALTCCYHGLNPPALTLNGVPQSVTRAVTQSAIAVLVINALFAYLVFGVLFFGLVKAVV